ncbi:ATP-binding protein [Nocardia salmonicida]|uniref:ATP-binding protein n=1 Tax=Nocardia salmonicida TaxID=53431 RepID=UPI003CF8E108
MSRSGISTTTNDYDRVVRPIALLLAATYLAYALMLSGRILAETRFVAPWWTMGAVGLTLVGPALLFGWAALTDSPRRVRLAATISAAGFPLVALAWPFAWYGEELASSSWLSFVSGLAAMSTALLWRPTPTVLYLLIVTTAAQAINQQRTPSANFAFALELVYSFGFSLVFVATVIEALRTARMLDQTRTSAELQAATTASAEALTAQQRTHAGVIHDWVLATLLAAERLPDSDQLRQQAITTLNKIDTAPIVDFDGKLSAQQVIETIRAAVNEIGDLVIEDDADSEESALYDAVAVAAIASGCAEAVRNSLHHNRSQVIPKIDVTLETHHIEVTVTDQGSGFDVDSVPAARLGVKGTIRQLDQLPGGTVTIISAPGQGTKVHFAWQRPPIPDTIDVRDFLGVRRRAAGAVTVIYFAGVCALATMSTHGVLTSYGVTALFLYAVMAVAFVWAPGDPIAGWVSSFAVLGPIGAWLALESVPGNVSIEQLWPASATAAIYVLLMLRGRSAAAWLGQASVLVTYAMWAVGHNIPPGDVVVARLADFAPLVGSAVFARLVRPRLRAILTIRREALNQARRAAAARTAHAEHAHQLHRFDTTSRALLTRLTRDIPLTQQERRECGLLEAQLRDRLRGGLLADSPVAEQIDHARTRGVIVNLYDDRTGPGFDPATWRRVTSTITAELARVDEGTVTIRIPPPGREIIATIVARKLTGTHRVAIRARETADPVSNRFIASR